MDKGKHTCQILKDKTSQKILFQLLNIGGHLSHWPGCHINGLSLLTMNLITTAQAKKKVPFLTLSQENSFSGKRESMNAIRHCICLPVIIFILGELHFTSGLFAADNSERKIEGSECCRRTLGMELLPSSTSQ